MSVKRAFKTLFEIMIRDIKAKNTVKRIQELKLKNISQYYPKTTIFYSDEKLITLKDLLDKIEIIYINRKTNYPNNYPKIENLFEQKNIGQNKVFFKDFHGVTASKSHGNFSFELFKEEEYKYYTTNPEKGFKCYDDIRNFV